MKGILAGIFFVLLAVITLAGYFLLNRGSSDTINLEDYIKLELKGLMVKDRLLRSRLV